MGDFNPAFAFDIDDRSKPAQTPWDFAGTFELLERMKLHAKPTRGEIAAYHGPRRSHQCYICL